MLDGVRRAVRLLFLAGLSAAIFGCASLGPIVGTELGSPVELDHVALLPGGRSIDVVVVGGAPLSDGKPCGTDYALASSTINGRTLEVLVKQTAQRVGECVLTELVCCEHHFTIALAADDRIDQVRDLGAPFDRVFLLTRPMGLYELGGLPTGWKLRHEWADWGGTWTRLYGSEAQYQRYPDVNNQIQPQWLANGQKLTLGTYEQHFSINDLVALANNAAVP